MSNQESKTFVQELRADWAVLPNLFTEVRGVLSPLPCLLLLVSHGELWQYAMATFVLVVLTDKADGWLARSRNEVTRLGTILDPIVDKLLVGLTLIALSIIHPLVWWPTLVILVREVAVAGFLARARKLGKNIAVIKSGKVKTVLQAVAITLIFPPLSDGWRLFAWAVVGAAVALTLTSGYDYYKAFREAE